MKLEEKKLSSEEIFGVFMILFEFENIENTFAGSLEVFGEMSGRVGSFPVKVGELNGIAK